MELQRRSHEDQINYLAGKLLEVTVQRNAAQRQLRQQCDATTDANEMLDEALVILGELARLRVNNPHLQNKAEDAIWDRAIKVVEKHA
jgi:hypothetical protein